MLPIGAVTLVASVLAVLPVLALAVTAPFDRAWWPWAEGWCLLALAVAAWNARAGIAMMSAFDWRPLPATLARGALAVAACPDWWLG